jgi:hypothetical protein
MTQQEQQLLSGLIERVNGTQLASKDEEAENLLTSAFQRNPDAVYILCQTVLVQQFAMDNAQRQLIAARAEVDSLKQAKPEQHGSFLGNLFGLGKTDDGPQQAAPPANISYNQPTGYAPVHNPAAPPYGYAQQPPPPGYPQQPPAPGYGYGAGYPQPGYGAPMGGGGGMFGGGGGFLQGAMQTAAGVVAGEFAFRAIEDVFHGFGGGGGERSFGGGTEVVNNYYDSDSSSHDGSSFGDRLQSADNLGSGISPDIEDRRGDSHGFLGGNDSSDTAAFADDDNNDDSSNYTDDGSNSDDGGSYDSGGDDNS